MSNNIPGQINIASWFIDIPATRYSSRLAVLGEVAAVTYAELRDLTDHVGIILRANGCIAGDRVLICLPDSVDFIAAFFGAAKIGAIPVPVSPFARAADYAFYVGDSQPRIAIAERQILPELTPGLDKKDVCVLVVDQQADRINATFWGESLSHAPSPIEPKLSNANSPAFLLYTSGSTGDQKAVIHTHKNMIDASECVGKALFNLCPEDRLFSISKPFFAFGLGFGVYMPLMAGASTIVSSSQTKLENVVRLIACHRPTILAGVPSFFSTLLQAGENWLPLDLTSVKFIVSAGEPLPIKLFEAFQERFGIEMFDGIGSTEMLTHFISNRPGYVRSGSCGVEVPGYEVRLIDENNQVVSDQEVGSLQVKGPSSFLGYWNNKELSERTLRDGWISTGDKMYRDADGYYYYRGRSDDMLKVMGMWVSSTDIEAVLCRHPAIERAVVTTREDSSGRRRLVAYIIKKDGATIDLSNVRMHTAQSLPEYMIPAAFSLVSELPFTFTGKLKRKSLPPPAWNETETCLQLAK